MTIPEFQTKNSEWLRDILNSQQGQELMGLLASLRPTSSDSPHVHLYADSKGQTRGYEMCLRNMAALTSPPRVASEAEANYGVSDKNNEPESQE